MWEKGRKYIEILFQKEVISLICGILNAMKSNFLFCCQKPHATKSWICFMKYITLFSEAVYC